MVHQIKESDWKLLRQLQPLALERFCQRVLVDIEHLTAKANESYHRRFLDVFSLLNSRNKELARAFDDLRRSNALERLALMIDSQLLGAEEFSRFSLETRRAVEVMLGTSAPNKRLQPTPR